MGLHRSNLEFHRRRRHCQSNPGRRRCRNHKANGIGRFGHRCHRLRHIFLRQSHPNLRLGHHRCHGQTAAGLLDMQCQLVDQLVGEWWSDQRTCALKRFLGLDPVLRELRNRLAPQGFRHCHRPNLSGLELHHCRGRMDPFHNIRQTSRVSHRFRHCHHRDRSSHQFRRCRGHQHRILQALIHNLDSMKAKICRQHAHT